MVWTSPSAMSRETTRTARPSWPRYTAPGCPLTSANRIRSAPSCALHSPNRSSTRTIRSRPCIGCGNAEAFPPPSLYETTSAASRRVRPSRSPSPTASKNRRASSSRRLREVSNSDGGGKASAFPHPMHGRERIVRVLLRFGEWRAELGAERMRLAEVNGQPGAVYLGHDGRAVLVVSLDIAEGLVQTIRAVSNPEKLRHLGPRAGGRWRVDR